MPKAWHKEDIKAAVRKRGKTLIELSKASGHPAGTCSIALFRPHFAGELVIAEFLGVSPREIWPQRYDADGSYLHPKSEAHHTRRLPPEECQKGEQA
jgi:Ner family transcriptional regulator